MNKEGSPIRPPSGTTAHPCVPPGGCRLAGRCRSVPASSELNRLAYAASTTRSRSAPLPSHGPPRRGPSARHGANAAFRAGLRERRLAYAPRVKGELTAYSQEVAPVAPALRRSRAPPAAPLPHPAGQPARNMSWALGGDRPSPSPGDKAQGVDSLASSFVLLRVRLDGRCPKLPMTAPSRSSG